MPQTDEVWPVEAAKVPQLVFIRAVGTMLFANTKPDKQGRYFATCWFVFLFPLVPRGRYYVRRGRSTSSPPGWSSTPYTVFGRSRMRVWEVLRTYVLCWLVIPAAFIGPIVAGAIRSQNSDDNTTYMMGMMLLSFGLLGVVAVAYAIWRVKVRKVHEVRWVDDPRSQ